MAKKRHGAEQVVRKLREAEVELARRIRLRSGRCSSSGRRFCASTVID